MMLSGGGGNVDIYLSTEIKKKIQYLTKINQVISLFICMQEKKT